MDVKLLINIYSIDLFIICNILFIIIFLIFAPHHKGDEAIVFKVFFFHWHKENVFLTKFR